MQTIPELILAPLTESSHTENSKIQVHSNGFPAFYKADLIFKDFLKMPLIFKFFKHVHTLLYYNLQINTETSLRADTLC